MKMADRKQEWIREISGFIVDGHRACWAGDGIEAEPIFDDIKSFYYISEDGKLVYRDNYSGHFRAPGSIVVSQNNRTI
jgi:cobalamin biosynthesis protein CbiG